MNMNCYLIRTGEGLSFEVSIDDKVMKNLGHYMVDVKSSSEDPTSIFDILKDN